MRHRIYRDCQRKVLLPVLLKKLTAKYDDDTRKYKTSLRELESDFVRNASLTSLCSLTDFLKDKVNFLFVEYYDSALKKDASLKNFSDAAAKFLNTFCTSAVIFTGAIMITKSKISPGELVAMIGCFSIFGEMTEKVIYIIKAAPILENISKRLETIYSEPEEVSGDNVSAVKTVSAENLSYAYGSKTVFSGISFKNSAGDKVAVCGENGCGKSTLLKIICGISDEYEGSVKVNGTELKALSKDSWRDKFIYLPQDIYIFPTSLSENVRVAKIDADESDIRQITEALNLKDTENAGEISGGERRKVAVARLMLRKSPIVFFDEPESDLDSENVKLLKNFIKNSDCTVVYVSHDESLIESADKRIVLQR